MLHSLLQSKKLYYSGKIPTNFVSSLYNQTEKCRVREIKKHGEIFILLFLITEQYWLNYQMTSILHVLVCCFTVKLADHNQFVHIPYRKENTLLGQRKRMRV